MSLYDIFQIIKDYQTILSSILLPTLGACFYRWQKNIDHEQFLKQEKVRHDNRVEELRIEGQINGRIP